MLNRLLWLCFMFNMLAGLAYADGIDPVMQVRDPVCNFEGTCATQVGGPTGDDPFFFSSNGTGGGSFSFEVNPDNRAGFFTLDIQTPGVFDSIDLVNCKSDKFDCRVSFIDGTTDMFFTEKVILLEAETPTSGGFGPADMFTIVLNDIPPGAALAPFDPNGSGGWGAFRDFRAQANLSSAPTTALITAPEPSSLFLLGAGAATLLGRRKLRSKNT
jgi:hypothetical protein